MTRPSNPLYTAAMMKSGSLCFKAVMTSLALFIFMSPLHQCRRAGSSFPQKPMSASPPEIVLTVEEHMIASKEVTGPDLSEFGHEVLEKVGKHREKWRRFSYEGVDDINSRLKRFGYVLMERHPPCRCQPSYKLFHGEKEILTCLCCVSGLYVEDENFLFVAQKPGEVEPYGMGSILFYNGKVVNWDGGYRYPFLIKGDLIGLYRGETEGFSFDESPFDVRKNNETIYSFTGTMAEIENISFFRWKDDWVLECGGKVVISGYDLNEELKCHALFSYSIIKDKPFYFCQLKENGKVRLFYGGKELPYSYDEVVHYRCCEPSIYNPTSNENMIWFYALKDGFWFYVEAGIYD